MSGKMNNIPQDMSTAISTNHMGERCLGAVGLGLVLIQEKGLPRKLGGSNGLTHAILVFPLRAAGVVSRNEKGPWFLSARFDFGRFFRMAGILCV